MNKKKLIFSMVLALYSSSVLANWEYDGYYTRDGHYSDKGARFVLGARGGVTYGTGSMKNKVGSLYAFDGESEFNVSSLPVKENFSKFGFAANANIGFVVPTYSNWRIELEWDKIAKTEYNQIPLFSGSVEVTNLDGSKDTQNKNSGGVSSSITTDVISAMVYYDFFGDEKHKTANQFIPYVGLGIGYANSRTTLKLSDIYGDLSNYGIGGYDPDLRDYGFVESDGDIINFYESTVDNANVAALGSVGIAYGLTDSMFLDLNAKVIYIPEVKWKLSNETGSQYRDWFSAENMFHMNFTLGLRFEF
ncbi:MAG: hypothetical protein MJ156_01520 [Alphaproteobacteria bacterium]|nr:hypothetical protein [Alphaproteobacteria bacterium]